MLKKLKTLLFGELKDEVSHVEFNAPNREQLPFYNDWQKQIRL